jgi:hypothetical protein
MDRHFWTDAEPRWADYSVSRLIRLAAKVPAEMDASMAAGRRPRYGQTPAGTLRRLYNAGALTSYVRPSEEGPHRKYYGLNDVGRRQLAESAKTWREFADTMSGLLGGAT